MSEENKQVKPEEAKPEEVKEPVSANDQQKAVEEMEKASNDSLQSMKEEGNAKNEKVLDEAKQKLDTMYANFKAWLKENTQPEKVKAEAEKVKEETTKLLNETRQKVIEVSNNKTFKETMAAGGKFLSGTGEMISEGFKYGYDKLMGVPEIKKVADKVDEGVDKLRQSKLLKEGAEAFEKGVSELNNAIFSGLKNFFDDDKSEKEAPKDDSAKK